MPPAVEVLDLTKRYGELTALDQVSLTVEEGECVALLGPNGAGKSTLVECLTTLKRPTSGTIRVAGIDPTEQPSAARARLGVAFQEAIANKHMTAREVLLHHARLYGVDRHEAQARADKLISFVGLDERAGDRVKTYSGGMKRRVDLARVLVTEPDVLLLDEPTAGLDPQARREMRQRLRTLVDEGTTLLIATHDLEEAQRLAERVAILDEGELVAAGRPGRLARDLGRRVVRVELPAEADRSAVREALEQGDGRVLEAGDAIELLLPEEGGPSPGEIVDRLERAAVGYGRVTVREPDLGDVFLELTGHPLAGRASEVDGA